MYVNNFSRFHDLRVYYSKSTRIQSKIDSRVNIFGLNDSKEKLLIIYKCVPDNYSKTCKMYVLQVVASFLITNISISEYNQSSFYMIFKYFNYTQLVMEVLNSHTTFLYHIISKQSLINRKLR